MKKWILICCIVLMSSPAQAKRLHYEKHYQGIWCKAHNGQVEVVLPDRTRCDCLTDTHAVEMDFGNKWAEAIGQALYYSIQTGEESRGCLDTGKEKGL
jgi:hypothetical protein